MGQDDLDHEGPGLAALPGGVGNREIAVSLLATDLKTLRGDSGLGHPRFSRPRPPFPQRTQFQLPWKLKGKGTEGRQQLAPPGLAFPERFQVPLCCARSRVGPHRC